jgi:hypothetical protein
MAIVIAIIGAISGFFITRSITANRMLRENVTRSNIDTVVIALAAHVANRHRLPKPSLNNDGWENTTAREDLSGYVGYIPFHTLGISAKIASDGDVKPLIYTVEPFLTVNFSSLYETEANLGGNFCHPVLDPKISVGGRIASPDVVAFVIDVRSNPPTIADRIVVTVSKNTTWISRDMLLMKYLKGPPARANTRSQQQPTQEQPNDVDDFNF